MIIFRSIRTRLIVTLFPIFLLGVGFIVYYSYNNSVRHFGNLGKEGLIYAVNMAYILCEEQNKNVLKGKITKAEAQKRIITALVGPLNKDGKHDLSKVKIKIGKEDYFFAINSHGRVTMHPALPAGADVSKFAFIQKFIKIKNGNVYYKWKNKGEKYNRDKFAVIRYFEPWDWIIGIGAYMDHFTSPAKDQLQKSLIFVIIVSALFLAFLFAVIFSITMPLKKLKQGVQSFSPEAPETIDNIISHDEVGTLVDEINKMIIGLKEKNFIKETFGKYVSHQVQEAILANKIPLHGERKKVTLLFIDIRDFTELSEILTPEELILFLNDYFTSMVDAIISQGGTIDKFIGDAIMAVFGAPITYEDDSRRTLRAAELLMQKLDIFNKNRPGKDSDNVRIGIGIHTGEVIAGNIGSNQRMEYTVLGDTVNLASRIESLTKSYRTPVIFSDSTYRELMNDETIKMRELDSVRVKGRKRPVVLYEFYGFRDPEQILLMDRTLPDFLQGITTYKMRNWQEAINFFMNVKKMNYEDNIAEMYIERCEFLINNPLSEEWDGVFDFKQK